MEKFKPIKPHLSQSSARALLGGKVKTIDSAKLLWIQNWLEQKAREQMLPPQIYGKEAYSALLRFLAPEQSLLILKELRLEFARSYPQPEEKKDEELEKQISYLDHLLLRDGTLTNCETASYTDSLHSEESED